MGDGTKIGAGSTDSNWGVKPNTTQKEKNVKFSRGHSFKQSQSAQGQVDEVGKKSLTPPPIPDRAALQKKLNEKKFNALKNQLGTAEEKLKKLEEILQIEKGHKELEERIPRTEDEKQVYNQAKLDVKLAKKEVEKTKSEYEKALNEKMNEAKKKLIESKLLLDISKNTRELEKLGNSDDKEELIAKASSAVRDAEKEHKAARKEYDALKKEYEAIRGAPKSILKKTSEPIIQESNATRDQDEEAYLDEQIAQAEQNTMVNQDNVEDELKVIHNARQELRKTKTERIEAKQKLEEELEILQKELKERKAILSGLKGESQTKVRYENEVKFIEDEIGELKEEIHKIDSGRNKHLQDVNEFTKKESSQIARKNSGKGVTFNPEVKRNRDGKISREPLDGTKQVTKKTPKTSNE